MHPVERNQVLDVYQQEALQDLESITVRRGPFPPFEVIQELAEVADAKGRPEFVLGVLAVTSSNIVRRLNILKDLDNAGDPNAQELAVQLITERKPDFEGDQQSPIGDWLWRQGALQEAFDVIAEPTFMQQRPAWCATIKAFAFAVAVDHANEDSPQLLDQVEQKIEEYKTWLHSRPEEITTPPSLTAIDKLSIDDLRNLNGYVRDPNPETMAAIQQYPAHERLAAHNAVLRQALAAGSELPDAQVEELRAAVCDPDTEASLTNLHDFTDICMRAKRYDLLRELVIKSNTLHDWYTVDEQVCTVLLHDAVERQDHEQITELLNPKFTQRTVQIRAARSCITDAANAGDRETVALLSRKLRRLTIPPYNYHGQPKYGTREAAIHKGLVDIARGNFDGALNRAAGLRRRRELLYARFLPRIIELEGDTQTHLSLTDQKISSPEVYRETYQRIAETASDDQFRKVKTHVRYNLDSPKKDIAESAIAERLAGEYMREGQWREAMKKVGRVPNNDNRARALLRLIISIEAARPAQTAE